MNLSGCDVDARNCFSTYSEESRGASRCQSNILDGEILTIFYGKMIKYVVMYYSNNKKRHEQVSIIFIYYTDKFIYNFESLACVQRNHKSIDIKNITIRINKKILQLIKIIKKFFIKKENSENL